MPDPVKICGECAHGYTLDDQPKYRRCRKSDALERSDATLCGEMRKGACGPTGTLWEALNGP